MSETDITIGIDHTIQRHPSQLEEIYFLAVGFRHRMLRVWQTDKWNVFVLPVSLKYPCRVRSYRQNFRAAAGELFISITQARQLRAAVGSHKAAQESEHHGFAAKIR